jgi:hypothetical protein
MRVAAFQSKCFPAYRLALCEGATVTTDKRGELTGNLCSMNSALLSGEEDQAWEW